MIRENFIFPIILTIISYFWTYNIFFFFHGFAGVAPISYRSYFRVESSGLRVKLQKRKSLGSVIKINMREGDAESIVYSKLSR